MVSPLEPLGPSPVMESGPPTSDPKQRKQSPGQQGLVLLVREAGCSPLRDTPTPPKQQGCNHILPGHRLPPPPVPGSLPRRSQPRTFQGQALARPRSCPLLPSGRQSLGACLDVDLGSQEGREELSGCHSAVEGAGCVIQHPLDARSPRSGWREEPVGH